MKYVTPIDEIELSQIRKHNPLLKMEQVSLNVSQDSFEFWYDKIERRKNRRGEVVMVLQDSRSEILLHTKATYPTGIFRLLSGGIDYRESVIDAALRESFEETSLDVKLESVLGIITTNFINSNKSLQFVSYIVNLSFTNGEPFPHDPNEKISGYKTVSVAGLKEISYQLNSLKNQWQDWGRFRALAHDLAYESLSSEQ